MFSFPTDSPRDLIARLATARPGLVSKTWTHDVYRAGNGIALEYRYRIVCADTYYGDACRDQCVPRDDKFGHYECGENGVVCMEGWQGTYCDQRKYFDLFYDQTN